MNDSSSESRCPQCGGLLPANAPHGLCPKCLLLDVAQPTEPGTGPHGTKILQPAPALEAVRTAFPQLEVLELIGRGGMGVVYKARQKSLNRLVALKLLAPERVADAKFAARFAREAQALAALNHPDIVTIHDFGQAGGFYFLLMEFVDGVNLRQAMKAGRFTPEQALAIVPPVCEALQYAHEHGIVHRDIKPENLLLDKDGRVKIADFGIAKMLGTETSGVGLAESQPAGTPQYMSPEQRDHQRTDHRADIYSLGVVLYELLTGELPGAKLQPPSRKVQIDVRLDEIVLRALEQRPELRFQTAAELRTQVQTVVSSPCGNREAGQTSSVPPRFLKAGTSTLATPADLTTVSGQFFCYRTRGQLILDDRQLTHSCAGVDTVIPLAAIRDLGIGRYPRTMNPAGIDFLSVIYEDGGRRKQVLLSPMKGWFSDPWSFNAHIAEWHAALREAVQAATGRPPASSPVQFVGAPFNSFAPLLALAAVPVLVGVGLMMFVRRNDAGGGFAGALGLFEAAVFAVGFFAVVLLNWFLGGRMRRAGFAVLLSTAVAFALIPLIGFLVLPMAYRAREAQSTEQNARAAEQRAAPTSLNPQSPAPAPELVFGPVIERVITFNETGASGLMFVNLAKAELLPPPFPLPVNSPDPDIFQRSARIEEWIAASGVDMALHLTDHNWGFTPLGTRLIYHKDEPDDATFFERVTLKEAQTILADPKGRTNYLSSLGGRVSAYSATVSYVFKTRRGTIGLLQMTGFTDNPRGVKIRYKLAQPVEAAGIPTPALLEKVLPTTNATTAIPQHIEFKVLRIENPPGSRTLRLHFEGDANPSLGFEVGMDAKTVPGGQLPEFKDAFWLRTSWVGAGDAHVLSWTLPEPFTPDETQAAAARIEKELLAQRDAWSRLPDGAVPKVGSVRHRDGWSCELFFRVKRGTDFSPAQPANAWAVEGTVRDGNGQPVADANIHVSAGMGSLHVTGEGKSGADGRYRVTFGPAFAMAAKYRAGALQAALVHAGKDGYAEKNLCAAGNLQMAWELTKQQLAGGWQPGPQRTFLPGKPLTVDFVLVPAAQIQGTLLDQSGKPVVNREIVITGERLGPGGGIYGSTRTDSQGRFTFKDVSTQHAWSFSIDDRSGHPNRTAPDRFTTPTVHRITLQAEGDALKRVDSAPTTSIHGTMNDDDLKRLSWRQFDQTPGRYWRELADVRRFKEAAELIERYLSLHPELDRINASNLHFHAGQCWAMAGEKGHALNQLRLARHPSGTTIGLRWNDYVYGTEAFLKGDKRELLNAHESLAESDPANKPNLCVLDRLLANFGKSYAGAYETDGQDHKKLSADCFNRAWELLDKKERTAEENERMVSLAHASLAHWRMREDCTDRNLSIGYWQLSRVYAVLGQGNNAERYGGLCLRVSGKEPPFYLAYAHEALARAALLNGRRELFDKHLADAKALAATVADPDEKKSLEDDLASLRWGL